MTVQIGGIPTTFARTQVAGVPLAFAVITVVVGLLVVGVVAMTRYVAHPAPFCALLARGFAPSWGLAGAVVAFVGYNAIQISLYALLGVSLAGVGGTGSWLGWAAAAWLLVGVLGLLRGAANAKVLGTFLSLELAVIACFVIAALIQAPGGISVDGLAPSSLIVPGVSGVLAFTMAAFVGVETPAAFAEEARPAALGRAVFGALGFLGVLYLVVAVAYMSWVGGAGSVVAAAADEQRQPLVLLGRVFGAGVMVLATLLLATSVLAAMSAFHAAVARYVFALARERLLPRRLSWVSRGASGGAPVGGSLVQSGIAAAVVAGFAITGADPMGVMFSFLSTIGALAVLLLLIAASWASRSYFLAGGGRNESLWVRHFAPVAGVVSGVLVVAMMVANLGSILGTPPGSWLAWLPPALIGATVFMGLVWGAVLRLVRKDVWAGIGRGVPNSVTVVDARLSQVKV